jgi:hypothetical protein
MKPARPLIAHTDSFVFCYTTRIMACLTGHDPVELYRTRRDKPLQVAEINYITRDLDSAWEWWIERVQQERHLISSRPKLTRPQKIPRGALRIESPSHTYAFLSFFNSN